MKRSDHSAAEVPPLPGGGYVLSARSAGFQARSSRNRRGTQEPSSRDSGSSRCGLQARAPLNTNAGEGRGEGGSQRRFDSRMIRDIRNLLFFALPLLILALAPARLRAAEGVFASDASGNLIAALSTNAVAPVILAPPVSQVVAPGGNAGFSVIASGTTPLTYQWRFNDVNIPGATGDSLFLSNVTTNQEGAYRVLVANAGGNVLSAPALLQIDADGDGLPDSWELTFFGSLTNQNGAADRDLDGVSNLDEYREGTNPTNAASLFPRLNLVVVGPGRVAVSPLATKYSPGQIVALTAVPGAGASFLGWSGDVTNSTNPLSLTMDTTKDITALFGLPLEVALDSTGLVWISGGAAGWLGQTNTTHDLIDAAQSGPIAQGQQSWLQTTVINPLPVAVDFWWRLDGTASPLGSDSLAVLLNGTTQTGTLINDVAWQQKNIIVPPGTNVVRWLYTKLSTTPRYLDIHNGGFVDQVTVRPIAAISVADVNVVEGHAGTNLATFTLTLKEPVAIAASVRYFTTNGSALAGSDYLAAAGTVNFAAGGTSQTVVVPILGDLNLEGDESFRLVLHTPVAGYLIDNEAVGTIRDDEIAPAGATLLSESCVSPNGQIDPGETVTVRLQLRNPGPFPTANLTATLVPANGVLPPGTTLDYGVLPPDNSPVARTFTFTANGPCGSNLIASLSLQDGSTNRGSASFTFPLGVVTTTTNRFVGPPLNVPLVGPATNYPSPIAVSGIAGTVSRVAVTLDGLQHLNPDDLDVLLVGPAGQTVLLLSDAGGTTDATGVAMTFEDRAPAFVADATALISGAYKPSNYDTNTDALPAPAPAGPYGANLAGFNGVNPNGTWQLFVNDDAAGNGGTLSNGWTLTIETFDASCCTSPNQPDLAVSVTPPAPVVVGHDAVIGLTIQNRSAFTANNVILTNLVPDGLQLIAASASQGTVTTSSTQATGNLGAIAAGASATVSITVRPTRSGSFTNVVSTLGGESDPNYANNTGLAIVTAVGPTIAINDLTVPDFTTNAVFAVTLSTFSSQEISVRYHTTNGTATAGADFVATNGLLTFNPGTTTQFVTVRILGDVLSEANETFSVVLTLVTNATLLDGTGVGTITDDDQVPGISIDDLSLVEGNGGTRSAVFTVRLSAPSGQSATVAYATANGTAIAPADYTARSGTLTFAVGVTTQTVAIVVNGDVALEPDETFFLRLSNPVRATLTETQAVATILNDELVSNGSILETEGCDPANGVIDPGETVAVTFAFSNPGPLDTTNLTATLLANDQLLNPSGSVLLGNVPGDGSLVGATFTFAANGFCGSNLTATVVLREGTNSRGSLTYTFPMGVITETTNTFTAPDLIQIPLLGSATNYPSSNLVSGVVGTVSRVMVTLNGLSHLNPDDLDVLLVAPGGQSSILLSDAGGTVDATNLTVTFDPSAATAISDAGPLVSGTYRPADYQVADPFPAPAPAGPYPANLAVFNGVDPNGWWRLFVVDDATGSTGEIAGGWTLTIQTFDADCCTDSGAAEIASAGLTTETNTVVVGHDLAFTFTVTNRSAVTATGVMVTNWLPGNATFVSARGSQGDCTLADGTVTCFLGDVAGFSSVTTTVIVAPNRPGGYTNAAAVIANQLDPNTLNNAATATASAVIPSFVVTDASVNEGDSPLDRATYLVRLSAFSSQPIWLRYTSVNGTALSNVDYLAVSGLLFIPPGATSGAVTVSIPGDLLNEANKTFSLNFSSATNATLTDASAIITIVDNDPLPVLSIDNLEVPEGDAGTNFATLTALLSAPSGRAVTVVISTANGTALSTTDYIARGATTLTFPAGTTSQPITVGIRGDTLFESNETFFVNLSSPVNLVLATNRAIVTIRDDDFRLTSIEILRPDVRLRFNSATGQSNRVEWAATLAPGAIWSPVPGATNLPGTGTAIQVIDPNGATQQQRFYRIRRLP